MLTDLIELGQKMKKANEGYSIFILFHEIKQNTQGTDSDRKETKIQSNHLEQKEKKINIQPEWNEETRIKKSEETLTNLWDNLKCSNIWIIGLPAGEEQQQEIEKLFEQ